MCLKGNRHGKNLCRFFFIKLLTYGAPYDIIITGGEIQMSNKKKKHKLEKVAIIVSIFNGVVTAVCMIYETFFK